MGIKRAGLSPFLAQAVQPLHTTSGGRVQQHPTNEEAESYKRTTQNTTRTTQGGMVSWPITTNDGY